MFTGFQKQCLVSFRTHGSNGKKILGTSEEKSWITFNLRSPQSVAVVE